MEIGRRSGAGSRSERNHNQNDERRVPSQQIVSLARYIFDEARSTCVVRILAAEAVQTLIIKVLQVTTGDLLEAGCGERKIRGTILAADSVSRHRRGGTAAAGGGASCDCGMRRHGIGAGVFVGAHGRRDAPDCGSRLRGNKQSAATVTVR